MIAPFASLEQAELPTKFDALTLAQTLDPHTKLNGALLSVVAGKVHQADVKIVDDVPAQFIGSSLNVTPSLYLIIIVKAVKELPPLYG